MKYDKDEIKRSLTIEQVYNLVAALGGNPRMLPGETAFISRTICHEGNSHKLYYYANSQLFQCFTNCGYFDVFGLIQKVKGVELVEAIENVIQYFGLSCEPRKFTSDGEKLEDWAILEKYHNLSSISTEEKRAELKIFDSSVLTHLPRPRILDWEREGISPEVMNKAGICYNPINQSIIIPHYNRMGKLIGIRERTLIKEEEKYGKYRPAILNGQMYNHPLSFNLYNLNNSAENIAAMGAAIVFEGEKGPLKFASLFGMENDISVASCGSSLINYQVDLLLAAGAKEIIIAYDKQFKEPGDDEFKLWTKKLTGFHDKYSSKCHISFMFDTSGLLGYKESPIDRDKDTFLTLYKERITL